MSNLPTHRNDTTLRGRMEDRGRYVEGHELPRDVVDPVDGVVDLEELKPS